GTAAPTVLACHESATLRARDVRRAGSSAWRRLAARLDERVETTWARTWFGAATACVVESEDDRRALAEHVALERVEVIPAGIDDAKHAYRRSGEHWRLVFTGDLSAPRDVEAARRLAGALRGWAPGGLAGAAAGRRGGGPGGARARQRPAARGDRESRRGCRPPGGGALRAHTRARTAGRLGGRRLGGRTVAEG